MVLNLRIFHNSGPPSPPPPSSQLILKSEFLEVATNRIVGLVAFDHFGYLNWSFFRRKFVKKRLLSTKPQSMEEVRRFMFHWWDYKSLRAVTIPCNILFYPLDIFFKTQFTSQKVGFRSHFTCYVYHKSLQYFNKQVGPISNLQSHGL